MFIKTTKSKNYEYIKLVESYWENGGTKHKVLYNFGRKDLIKNNKMFINIVKKLCEIAEIPIVEERKAELFNLSEATMLNYGYMAYLKIWEELGIANCMRSIQENSKIQFPLSETIFLMAVQHLLSPKSKLSTYENQENYYGIQEIMLQHLYRSLDRLAEEKEFIESRLFEENYRTTDKKVDVVFYDVTTFAFESVIVDELRNFGFSKDCKFKEVQVVMGLLIDENSMPLGYELFPGNTFDGKTMVESLNNLKKRFGINRVIIVADRGLNSKGNLNLIKEAGYGYIMASKIKGMKKAIKEQILDKDQYAEVKDKEGNLIFKYKIFEYTNSFTDENKKYYELKENLIVSHSDKRAKKDKADRARLIEKAKKLLENPENIKSSNKRSGRKYLNETIKTEQKWELDVEKIEQDEQFDGYYGIQTSEKGMSANEVMEAYHTLWKIEDAFRVMKSTLEVRPVFHWTPSRIHGHFVVCFLAFLMERKLEMLLNSEVNKIDFSPEKIRSALNSMQLASVHLNGEKVFIKTKNLSLANKIFKLLNIKTPSNVNKEFELQSCFEIEKKKTWGQLSLF